MAGSKTYRDQVAEEIIAQLEAGTAPWQKPWSPTAVGSEPMNPTTGKPYRGINTIWLDMQGYQDPRWMTFRQAQELGGRVNKGEKSTTIEYWQWTERRVKKDADGKTVLDDQGRKQYVNYRLERPKVFYAKVFNADQIEGLDPYVAPEPKFSPIEEAERILKGTGVPIKRDQADRAFYDVALDKIHMPTEQAFDNAYDYYSVALHEAAHATGHKSRLDRQFGPFGSETYAKEELRAEIASSMIARKLGIGHEPERHAAYVGSWLKVLKQDKHEIFRAARDADTIQTWIMAPAKRQELERTAKSMKTEAMRTESIEQSRPSQMKTPDAATENTMTSKPKRQYLHVPYEERTNVKKVGAKWDRKQKAWYVLDTVDPDSIQRWVNPPAEALEQKPDPRAEFASVLEKNGFALKDLPTMDGKWHRVAVEGDKGQKKSGSYRGFLDEFPTGQFQNFKLHADAQKWRSTGNMALTEEERARMKAEMEERSKAREQERLKAQRQVARTVYGIYANAKPVGPEEHPYLKQKQVSGDHLKIDRYGNLLIPMVDVKGFQHSMQTIKPDGTKLYPEDARKTGLLHHVNPELEIGKDRKPVFVTEGYSTGKTIETATNRPTVAAFDAGNLRHVVKALLEHYPGINLVLAADDDHHLHNPPGPGEPEKPNKGRDVAASISREFNIPYIVPRFTEQQKLNGLTDWNDLEQDKGEKVVKAQIRDGLKIARGKILKQEKTPKQSMALA